MITRDDVTVVVPVYEAQDTLLLALQSVVAEKPFEIILVDDHSTVPLERPSQIDWPLKILHHDKNRGPGAARNTGVRASTTEWVAFIDADDLWEAGRLDLQIELANAGGCDVVLGKTGYLAFRDDPHLREAKAKVLPFMGSMLVRRSTFLKFLQAETFNFGEDLDFYMQLKENKVALEQHPDIVCWYRRENQGITAGRSAENKKKDLMRVLRRSVKRRRTDMETSNEIQL